MKPRSSIRLRGAAAGLLCVVAAAVVIVAVRSSDRGSPSRGSSHPGTASLHRATTSAPAGGLHRGRSARAPMSAAQLARSPQMQRLIALGRPIYCAGRHGHELALTFDDGPGPYTRLVLAKLRKHHVRATFFVVGRNIPLVPGAIRGEAALGAVGDHTFTHPLLTSLAPPLAEAEIVRTQQALERSSRSAVVLFRPPYGAHNATVDRIARRHHLLEILWNVDSADSLGAGWSQIERNVIAGMHPGSIILMHENHGQTVRALPGIFAALQRRHLHAVSVTRLLTEDPPGSAQVRHGGSGCRLAGGAHGD